VTARSESDKAQVINKRKFFDAIKYEPHRRQMEYHASPARFRVPVCGRRFGKSTMAARDLEPELFLPNRWYWIVGPTYDLGEKEFRVIWDDLIIKRGLGKDKRVRKAYNKKSGDMYIEFPWRTRVEVRSAEHPENLVGEGLHGAIMSEAAKHRYDTWERYIRPALADYRGWATFPTTPEGQNWLYKLWQFGMNPKFPDYQAWRFPSWENPYVYPGGRQDEEIKLIEATTSPEWFEQEIAADFTAFVGKIYGEFSDDTHCINHTFNPAWPNYMCIDWGVVNPFTAIEFQVDAWDNVYIWREYQKTYSTLGDHIEYMKNKRDQPDGYHLDLAFADAAEPGSAMTVSEGLVGCMAMPEAKESWVEGVELVKQFLKLHKTDEQDEFGTPVYKPRLFVDWDCPNTIRQFNNYRAREGVNRGKNLSSPRENAQTYDDDCMDAIRYGLVHLFKLGCSHHLEELWSPSEQFRIAQQVAKLRSDPFESAYTPSNVEGLFVPTGADAGTFFSLDKEF
jgi:hypothetical protein